MKIRIIIISLLISKLCFSQNNLPNSVTLKLYYGGDFRSELYGLGATDETDLLTFNLKIETDSYNSNSINQIRKVFLFSNGEFIKKNINKDSTITLLDETIISKEEISQLIKALNKKNYEESSIQDEITFENEDKLYLTDTILLLEEIALDHFNIKKDKLVKECQCRIMKEEINLNCSKLNFKKLLKDVLKKYSREQIISSYIKYVEIYFELDENHFSIIQNYPGELNFRWNVNIEGLINDNYILFNPRINKIIQNLIPNRFKNKFNLTEVTEESQWIKHLE